MINKNLANAKKAKNDEFYTQLSDIEKEFQHYTKHFKGKVVFCNCDDPTYSNFWKYFHLNFGLLELKKLVTTHYSKYGPSYKMEYLGGDDNNCEIGIQAPLKENGDFRSQECVDILKGSDIVVTNPPFSLFREYVAVLMEHDKKFVIIGSQNAITYKEIFPFLKDNKMWLGNGFRGNVGFFSSPYEDKAASSQHKEGMIRVSGVMWFTNLDIKKRHEEMILVKKYSPDLYPQYETFDGIDVSVTSDIPCDYDGIMGVPKTFMQYYNPDQFEILGYEREDENIQVGIRNMPESFLQKYRQQGGKGHYTKGMKMLCYYDIDGNAKIPFSRILIRNKHPEAPKGAINNEE